MIAVKERCVGCSGLGYTNQCFTLDENGTMQDNRDICKTCNGTGSIERFAVFTIEEAKAILKHCGLTTEG